MRKVLITGGTGFIGKSLVDYFTKNGYIVHAPSRAASAVDWTDRKTFYRWVESELSSPVKYDFVVHCAINGGRRLVEDDHTILYDNIVMLDNIMQVAKLAGTKKVFNIGSGAEQDRKRGVYNLSRPNYMPTDWYGLSKRIVRDKYINDPLFTNIRAFGVFGENEEPQRFIKSAISSYKKKKPIHIHKEKRMDFFYVEDIARVIEAIFQSKFNYSEVNLSYPERMLYLGDFAKFINTLGDHEVPIVYDSRAIGPDYFGNNEVLRALKLNLTEQKNAIRHIYRTFK